MVDGTTSGWFVEFQAAVLRALPRDIARDTALEWIRNGKFLTSVLKRCLTGDSSQKALLEQTRRENRLRARKKEEHQSSEERRRIISEASTLQEAADKLGLTREYVQQLRKAYNLSPFERPKRAISEERRRIISEASTLQEAADKLGLTREAVRRYIKKYDLEHPKDRRVIKITRRREAVREVVATHRKAKNLRDRFHAWIHLDIPKENPMNSCWGWTGQIINGYPRIHYYSQDKKTCVSFSPAKELMTVCRPEITSRMSRAICGTPYCLNPWHREPYDVFIGCALHNITPMRKAKPNPWLPRLQTLPTENMTIREIVVALGFEPTQSNYYRCWKALNRAKLPFLKGKK